MSGVKYNFFEALAIVAGSNRKIRYINRVGFKSPWSHYDDKKIGAFLIDNKRIVWWPSLEEQKEKKWEVEGITEEIFIWACCDEDGLPRFFFNEPYKEGDHWFVDQEELPSYLFPTDKAVKFKFNNFKFVKVEEEEE
jgi:hypothetical protein